MIWTCVRIGAVLELEVQVDGVAVDQVSRAIVEIAADPDATGKNFNIVNPEPISIKTFSSYGYDIATVPVDQWINRIEAKSVQDIHLLPFFHLVSDRMAGTRGRSFFEMQVLNRQSYSGANLMAFLKGTGLAPRAVDEGLFHNYLDYLKGLGFLSEIPECQGSGDGFRKIVSL